MPSTTLDNHHIDYSVAGEGEALVLIHGLGTDRTDWHLQIPEFSKHFKVIAQSLTGFGDSDHPKGPYSVTRWAREVVAVLDAEHIDKAHVMAISMGGAVAFEFALNHSERLNKLIILNSQPSFAIDKWYKTGMLYGRVFQAHALGMDYLARAGAQKLLPHEHQAALRDDMQKRFIRDKHGYLAGLYAVAGWDRSSEVHAITQPVLMLSAENDYTPLEEKRRLYAPIPNVTERIIPNSLHASHWDSPDEVNRAVLDFLQA